MAVSLGQFTIHDVNRGNDVSSYEALDIAKAIAKHRSEGLTTAIVHREDGLAIFRGEPDAPSFSPGNNRGVHFVSALCGYEGTGPGVAAEILELFGFGDQKVIFEQISSGGNGANFYFLKGVGLVHG